jgi:hypothetical protein
MNAWMAGGIKANEKENRREREKESINAPGRIQMPSLTWSMDEGKKRDKESMGINPPLHQKKQRPRGEGGGWHRVSDVLF